MAEYSGIGLTVYPEAIPVHPSTRVICDALSIDPLRLISSGSLLISSPYPELVIRALNRRQISCTPIGDFAESGFSMIMKDGRSLPLDPPSRDQVYKL
jgi:hydrogenase expression/formation protein HypE